MKKPTSLGDLADLLSDINDRLHQLEYKMELIRKHSQNLNRRVLKVLNETPKKQKDKDNEVLTPKEVATLLSLSITAVHERMNSGLITSIKIPGSEKRRTRRIPRSEVDRILKDKAAKKAK